MNKEIAICAIARHENLYIKEWVDHHLSIGFSHIYLFDNNRAGEERLSEVIDTQNEYAGKVTIIPYHDKEYGQWLAYYNFYFQYKFDWVAYIDADEFITLESKYDSISDFLDEVPTEFSGVYMNWMCYGDSGQLNYSSIKVQERFNTPMPYHFSIFNLWGKSPQNNHVKMIVKFGIKDFEPLGPHHAGGDFEACNTKFERIDRLTPFHDYTFQNCYVKHYITKSIGEYLVQKIRRQGALAPSDHYSTWIFFMYNRPTIKKLKERSKILKRYNIVEDEKPSFIWWLKILVKWYLIVPLLKNTRMYNSYK